MSQPDPPSPRRAVWRNWAGNQQCTARHIFQPRCVEELQACVARAGRERVQLRAFGTRHSWSALVASDGYLLDVTRLDRWLGQGEDWVQVEAGMLTRDMNDRLEKLGRMVSGLTLYEGMTIGGMVSTGSHGSGLKHGSLSDQVVELTLVRHDGQLVRITGDDPATLRAARLGLGTLGILYSITLRTRPAFNMRARDLIVPLEEGLGMIKHLARENDHLSAYTIPFTGKMWFYIARETDEPVSFTGVKRAGNQLHQYVWFWGITSMIGMLYRAWPATTYPLLRAGRGFLKNTDGVRTSRHAYHYLATFPNLVDSEYAFDFERVEEGYRCLLQWVDEFRARGSYPISMALHARFVKGGDAYLSPTAGRDSVCLEAATGSTGPATAAFYRGWGDDMLKAFDARPHWGKEFSNLPLIRQQYQKTLADFERVRSQFDPEGIFLNPVVRELLAG
jgi:FAD/FMN-containing dehydrogenase